MVSVTGETCSVETLVTFVGLSTHERVTARDKKTGRIVYSRTITTRSPVTYRRTTPGKTRVGNHWTCTSLRTLRRNERSTDRQIGKTRGCLSGTYGKVES